MIIVQEKPAPYEITDLRTRIKNQAVAKQTCGYVACGLSSLGAGEKYGSRWGVLGIVTRNASVNLRHRILVLRTSKRSGDCFPAAKTPAMIGGGLLTFRPFECSLLLTKSRNGRGRMRKARAIALCSDSASWNGSTSQVQAGSRPFSRPSLASALLCFRDYGRNVRAKHSRLIANSY